MINETALICGGFLSPLCKAVKMYVILFFNKTRTRWGKGRGGEGTGGEGRGGEGTGGEGRGGEGRGGEGKERNGREGGRCVCVLASAMFVNAIQQC